MVFHKGKPKTGGRKPGTPNKATVEIKEFARSILEDPLYQKRLKDRVIQGKAPHIEALLFHYAYGKPTETTGEQGATLEELVLEATRRREERKRAEALGTEVGE